MAEREDRAWYWAEVIRQFKDSGLSRAEFCRRQGIRPKSLGNWLHMPAFRRRIEQLGAEPPRPRGATTRFLPVVTTIPTPPTDSKHDKSATIDLILGPTRRLAIPTGFDAETLHRLLDLLEARP